MKVGFRKSGHRTAWGYKRELIIHWMEGSYKGKVIDRDTWLAKIILKYIIKSPSDFYYSGKRTLLLDLEMRDARLLAGLLYCDAKYWHLFKTALEEEWSVEKLEGKITWKVL